MSIRGFVDSGRGLPDRIQSVLCGRTSARTLNTSVFSESLWHLVSVQD